jgi:hypothetical protein
MISKGKVHPGTSHEGPEREQMYSPTLSLTSAQYGGGGSAPRPGRFTPPRKTRYPLYMRLGRPTGSVWTGAESFVPTGIRSRDRPARSESLYRLSYPVPRKVCHVRDYSYCGLCPSRPVKNTMLMDKVRELSCVPV